MSAPSGLGRAVVLVLVLAAPGLARAFSDPERYDAPTLEGGGGGRHFTGSPIDGLSCAVCHRPAGRPELTVEGFPTTFEPGQRYSVRLSWDASLGSHALQLELSTSAGDHAGVTLPAPAPAGRCEGSATGELATGLRTRGIRRVVEVSDCGASEVVLEMLAPDEPVLYLTAGVVRSDGSATPDGDAVLELRVTTTRAGDPASSGGCGAATGTAGLPLAALVMALALAERRRRTS